MMYYIKPTLQVQTNFVWCYYQLHIYTYVVGISYLWQLILFVRFDCQVSFQCFHNWHAWKTDLRPPSRKRKRYFLNGVMSFSFNVSSGQFVIGPLVRFKFQNSSVYSALTSSTVSHGISEATKTITDMMLMFLWCHAWQKISPVLSQCLQPSLWNLVNLV